tara:strand:- start:1002 stop:2033 length:1032 start_codon:yes stop_codon:yes gene_type:complete
MRFKKTLFIVFFSLIFDLSLSYSQIAGESTYKFLNIPNSPRYLALGGKNVTIKDDDVMTGLFNPSSINEEMDNMFSVNYFSYFSDISFGSLAYAYRLDNRGNTIHFGFSYINYGDFAGYDEFGNYTSNFSGNESVFSVGYSRKINNIPIVFGSNVKFITSTFEQYNSYGMAADIGFFYNDKLNDIKASLLFRNIGFQIKPYNEVNETLPFEIILGISQKLQNAPITWHLTMENLQSWPIGLSNPSRIITDLDGNISEEKISFFNEILRHTILGIELFPESFFKIQIGYSFRRSEELRILEQRNFSGISFGFGMKFNKLRFNYSHSRYSSASNVNFLGIQLDLY